MVSDGYLAVICMNVNDSMIGSSIFSRCLFKMFLQRFVKYLMMSFRSQELGLLSARVKGAKGRSPGSPKSWMSMMPCFSNGDISA